MASREIGTMSTGVVADGSQLVVTVSERDVEKGVALWVLGLAGVETASLWMRIGTTSPSWEEVEKDNAQVAFAVDQKHYTLLTAGDYGLTKTSTAGALTVVLEGV